MSTIHGLNRNESQSQFALGPTPPPRTTEESRPFWRRLPLVTTTVVIVCLSLWLYTFISGDSLANTGAVCPNLSTKPSQWYRYISSSFVHLGFLHVLLNMLIAFMLGMSIEEHYGSIPVIGQILSIAVISHIAYNLIFHFLAAVTADAAYLYQCTAGYSGVIFAYLWLFIVMSGIPVINFCGFFSIPARVYPFILLLLMSLLGSGVSFVGHLTGLLTGMAYTYGLFNWLTIPRPLLINFEQDTAVGRSITRLPGFRPTPDAPPPLVAEEHINFRFARAKYEDVQDSIFVRALCFPCRCCCAPRRAGGRVGGGGRVGDGTDIIRFSGSGWRLGGESSREHEERSVWDRVASVFSRPRADSATAAQAIDAASLESGEARAQGSVNDASAPAASALSSPGHGRVHRHGYAAFNDDSGDDAMPVAGRALGGDTVPAGAAAGAVASTSAGQTEGQSAAQPARADPRQTRPGRPVSRLVQQR